MRVERLRAVGAEPAQRRARRREIEALPEVLELVARQLRAGRNLHRALSTAGDELELAGLGEALRRVADGERLVDAIDRWAGGLAHPDADLVRAVLGFGLATGGSLVRALDRASATLRDRVERRDEVRVLTAQARVSAAVLAAAPPVFVAVIAAADRAAATVLVTTALGRVCLVVGLLLDVAGFAWMHRLATSVSR